MLNISNSKIYDNIASGNGSGIYMDKGNIQLDKVKLYNNSAVNGAGIFMGNGLLNISNSKLYDNVASGDGGAIYVKDANLNVRDSKNGGGAYTSSSVEMIDVKVYNNTAINCGGGLYLKENNVVSISGSSTVFEYNCAIKGSAIYMQGNIPISLTNIKLLNNFANVSSITFNTVQDRRKLVVNATLNGWDNFLNGIWVSIPEDEYMNNFNVTYVTYEGFGGSKITSLITYWDIYGKDSDNHPTVHGAQNQNITFVLYDGTTSIGSASAITNNYGIASAEFDNLMFPNKDYTLKATHMKNDYYNYYANDTTVRMGPYEPEFLVYAPTIGSGENAVIYVVLPDGATGEVLINVTGVENYTLSIPDVSMNRSVSVKIDKFGSYTINATYNGDVNYLSTVANSTLFVERPNTVLNISVDDVHVGENVTFNFTVYSPVDNSVLDETSGWLHIYIDNKLYDAEVVNGKSQLVVPNLGIGSYCGICMYDGDSKYVGSYNTYKFDVSGYDTDLNIQLNKSVAFVGEAIGVTVTVNSNISGDSVYLYVNGSLVDIVLAENGIAKFTLNDLKSETYNITGVILAGNVYGNSTNSTMLS